MKSKLQKAFPTSVRELIRLPLSLINGGFTLIEILVVVLIIGILGAIALPQYQRALLKSRYAALMPIAKSMANSNEAYYLEHGIYADDPQDLLIQGQSRYTDDTELEFGTVSDYAYVLAKNEDKIPNNTFIVYQKHSGEFPGEIHCEALANNDLAESVCKSFGGNESIGKTLTDGYETYVLFGTGNGVAPSGDEPAEPEEPACPENSVCDEDGNVTGCASGYRLRNEVCETIPPCPTGSTCNEEGDVTGCATGYHSEGNACVETPPCPENSVCNEQGQVTGCSTGYKLSGNECVVGRTLTSSSCNSASCTYNFGADGRYLYYPNANANLNCYDYGGCGVGGTPDIIDQTLGADSMTVRFDENGNIQWFQVQADNKNFSYDGSGNFLGGVGYIDANGNGCRSGSTGCYQVLYKADGTIGAMEKSVSSYYYNNGYNSEAPIQDVTPYYLTNENNTVQTGTVQSGIVQELLSKPHKKCDLYPEIADCQTANSGN